VDRRAVLIASVGAGVVVSGIVGIAPAIPAMQVALALSDAEVSLLTSLYLLPSIFAALPAGLLADRIGTRSVFAGSLAVFGAGGVVLLFAHSLWELLAVRAVQGAAFGIVLALSVSIIADVASTGPAAAKGQSRRVIAMAAGDAAFPLAGGALVAVSWYAPFAVQLLALPVAVAAWFLLPRGVPSRPGGGGVRQDARSVFRAPAVAGVQTLGALRFFFKFAVMTYFPLYAVTELGLSAAAVGAALGASSLLAVASAAAAEKVSRYLSAAQVIGVCLLTTAVALSGMALVPTAIAAVVAILLFGLQDGLYAVGHNVLVTEMAPAGQRSAYIGVTGAIRNVGKFVAPVAFGATTVVVTLGQAFLVFAGVGLAASLLARRVHRVEAETLRAAEAAAPR
jgi:ACDE family multidrug resistance protein